MKHDLKIPTWEETVKEYKQPKNDEPVEVMSNILAIFITVLAFTIISAGVTWLSIKGAVLIWGGENVDYWIGKHVI